MKKNLLIAAIAITALASCSSDEFVGDQSPQTSSGTVGAINFNMNTQAITRGTSDDATKLNNQFIVWGEKNEADGNAVADGNLVFPNYIVNYGASTAYTTTSNTNNWEYVGFKFDDSNANPSTASYTTYVTPNTKPNDGDAPAQTIKYWDDNATSYTFTAISANPTDISAGRVKIEKTKSGNDQYSKGYTVTLKKTTDGNSTFYPKLSDLYIADRINIAKGGGYNHNAVPFNFRNSLSQIRAGIYETIPGYSISSIKFYVNTSGENPAQTAEAKDNNNNSAFGAVCNNSATNEFEGTITVTYYGSGTDINKPILTVTPDNNVQKSNLILGTNLSSISTSSLLSETASQPSWDKANDEYTAVLSQATSSALKLKCDYTLYNPITKETISITGKTAEIPAQYLQWKANYKYSYVFKITDNELTPITFDAVVVTNENGSAEYITTVSEPSITTIGVKDSKYSVGNTDYDPSTDVYATVMDASTLATLSASNFSIYDVTSTDATNFPVTEASVAEALIEGPTWTKAQADLKKITCAAGPELTFQNTVPAEDGTTKTLHANDNKAAKFTTVTGKKYALVYQKTPATYTTDNGQTYEDATAFANAGTLYTDEGCTTVAASFDNATTTYYKRTAVSNMGVYAIKIVTVE